MVVRAMFLSSARCVELLPRRAPPLGRRYTCHCWRPASGAVLPQVKPGPSQISWRSADAALLRTSVRVRSHMFSSAREAAPESESDTAQGGDPHDDGSSAGGAHGDRSRSSGSSSTAGGSRGSKPASKRRTFYDVLEVGRRATLDDIKASYRRLAKKYHPDRNVDDPEAEERFKEIQEAHATLSDKWKRALYDQDLQFGQYGSGATQEVEKEKWTEHWERETPEEREARKERYRRYAAGERNDLPPEPFPLRLTPVIFFVTVGAVFYVCIRAPDWFDLQSDPSHCDPAYDDRTVPLVRAFHDPVLNRWERLPEGAEPPTPRELYAHYKRKLPDVMDTVDLRILPKVSLTVMLVPRTETVKAIFRAQAEAAMAR